jgi:acyl carrier protein
MNRDEVKAVVLKHIAAVVEGLPLEIIDPTRSMRDYRVNSLDVVEIVSRSMRELKVKVPRVALRKLSNIDGLIDLLHQVTQAPPAVSAPIVTGQAAPPS